MISPICIVGSSGKVGSMFFRGALSLHAMHTIYTPRFGKDYQETAIYKSMTEMLEKSKTIIMCHHDINYPEKIYLLTTDIINNCVDTENVTIINIASDAEIINIPYRIKYGRMKSQVRLDLHNRNNRVINIFLPFVNETNYDYFFEKINAILLEPNYNVYYLSSISNIVKPLHAKVLIWNEPRLSEFNFPRFNNFSTRMDDEYLYTEIKLIIEEKMKIPLVAYNELSFFFVMWQLFFKTPLEIGKLHVDMKRCIFGRMFRVIICLENTSDYAIFIDGSVYAMRTNDILIIPDNVYHQPLQTTYGERRVIIFDFFTSSIPNYFTVFLFLLFNTFKLFDINV
jgi:hypothetical protein